MRTRLLPILPAALLALALTPGVAAAKGARADARAIGSAVKELRSGIAAAKPAIDANAAVLKEPGCRAAIEQIPSERLEDALRPVAIVEVEVVAHPIKPAFAAFGQRLEAVEPRDRALRGGLIATRPQVSAFAQIAAPPADFCSRMVAWSQAGYPAGGQPQVADPGVEALLESVTKAHGRRLLRAERRLRRLGVSRKVAAWFSGRKDVGAGIIPTDLPTPGGG
jgi:hypothetical protein